MKKVFENQLTAEDIHLIAIRSKICLETRLVYYVMRKSAGWSYGEIFFLEQFLRFNGLTAWTFLCIKHEVMPPKELSNHTTRLTLKDLVLKFTKKNSDGKIVMRSMNEFDVNLYKHRGSKSGRIEMKKDLGKIRTKLIKLKIVES